MGLALENNRARHEVLDDDEALYEIEYGKYVEKTVGAREVGLANVLNDFLLRWLHPHPIGRSFVEMLYLLDKKGKLMLRPDVSFVSYKRWPSRIVPQAEAWEMAPALAVEIMSKSNTAYEIQKKIRTYFKYGVELVWLVYPEQEEIHAYESPKKIRVLDGKDVLDGGKVLPGFRMKVASLFA